MGASGLTYFLAVCSLPGRAAKPHDTPRTTIAEREPMRRTSRLAEPVKGG